MTQNGLPIARPTPNTSQLSCESSCRWTVSETVLGWGSRPLVFFARYLAGRLERPAVLPCVAQTGVVSPVGGDQAPGITRGVSFRVRGQSSPHRAKQRLSAGRARDHPVMEIVPNKALSLSLSPQRTQAICQIESRHTVRRVSNGARARPSFAISEIKPRPRPLRLVQSH